MVGRLVTYKTAVLKSLEAMIPEDPQALSLRQRQVLLAEIDRDRLRVESEEACLIWTMQAGGDNVEHRADISPLALLDLRLVTTARTIKLPETSPGRSWLRR